MVGEVQKVSPDPYPLRGLLFCRCGQQFHPVESIDGSRAYVSLCGCRMGPLDADTVERLVFNAAEREAPALFVNLPEERYVEAFRMVFAEVTVGGTTDEISYVVRI